ncbi:hypothetical protein D3C85_1355580 [compost metagenome]
MSCRYCFNADTIARNAEHILYNHSCNIIMFYKTSLEFTWAKMQVRGTNVDIYRCTASRFNSLNNAIAG